LDEELRDFLEMAAEEKIKQGMSRKDALRAVHLERGNVEVTKEVVRGAGWESLVETWWQDLRFATDPEQRQARNNGSKFTVLSVATQRSGRTHETSGARKPSGTASALYGIWTNLKGDHVLVEGMLVNTKYEREQGKSKKAKAAKSHGLLERSRQLRAQVQLR